MAESPITELVQLFARLPGIGERSAARLAFHVLGLDASYAKMLAHALDTLHAEYVQAIMRANDNTHMPLNTAVQLALVGRYYERIGDHAVNIGERTQYMITGRLPEHSGVARVSANPPSDAGER